MALECYKCQYCKKVYDTKKEAEECEVKHSTDLVITDLRFDYCTSDMPNQIKLTNKNGVTKTYKLL